MQIDLRTVTIKPLRQTFDHIAERLGDDKPASRYQEGTLDLQPTANFHYRPTWDPDHEIFDAGRTRIVMADWYSFKDPRQYYYATYTQARARQQEVNEGHFAFVEQHGLDDAISLELRRLAIDILLPMRHVAWGANLNNAYACAYGYGTAITQPCMYHAMDQLGIAQYLSRIGLMLGSPEALDRAKSQWMDDPKWQGVRRFVEDCLVTRDWFELLVAQALVLDGLLYPLVFETIVVDKLAPRGGTAVTLMTEFMREWQPEEAKWIDAQLKTAIGESDTNKAILSQWVSKWRNQALEAITPLARFALGDHAADAVAELDQRFIARIAKVGLVL